MNNPSRLPAALRPVALNEQERKDLARQVAEANRRSEDNARMKGGQS
ncbi:hypothetical protein [Streptomyces iconiensis]|uniref:Uncharacterized protein n=1 Tax=Streptomyces iconiensis TaxID=1384038 RepID=A0ABT7ABY7_9ACTN|nr:hypothetical protein [Streptomyces iconiensis]MDJ1138534.1 hypothetical protein [Streptomyces iconiensis]